VEYGQGLSEHAVSLLKGVLKKDPDERMDC